MNEESLFRRFLWSIAGGGSQSRADPSMKQAWARIPSLLTITVPILIVGFSSSVVAGVADIEGSVSYSINGDRITIEIDRIKNNTTATRSGTIYVSAWFNTDSDIFTPGYRVARVGLNRLHDNSTSNPNDFLDGILQPGHYYSNLRMILSYDEPPSGSYYVHIFTSQHPDLDTVLDHVTMPNRLIVGGGGSNCGNNDRRSDATRINHTGSRSALMCRNGDVDYFRIEIPSRGRFVAETRGSLDTVGALEDGAGRQIATNDDDGVGYNFKIDATLDGGTHYLRVHEYGNDDTGDYTLITRWTRDGPDCGGDDHGDLRRNATPASLDVDVDGVICPQDDVDWFRFEIPSRGEISAAVEDSSADWEVAVELENEAGSRVGLHYNEQVDAGTYYARVADGFDDYDEDPTNNGGPYTLRISHTPVRSGGGGGSTTAVEQRYMVPLVLPGADPARQGFLRVINRSGSAGAVKIHAIDDTGQRKAPIDLVFAAGAATHFNSDDLESGNPAKGLSAGIGVGNGDWRLDLITDLDIEPLAYVRTSDGFVTSVHGTAARLRDGRYFVPFFNPGSNTQQVSSLRLINASGEAVDVTVSGLDDRGRPPPSGDVRLTLPAGESRTITSQELESGGARHSGRFGDGTGKWRLFVSASRPISVMSLLASPTGNLADLSARGRADWLPLVLSAANPEREGFVRIINHSSQSGTVRIRAIDDTGRMRGPVTLSLDAGAATHFNSGDLERGNTAKGLSSGVGTGQGNWRLELETDLNVEALAYVRTADGFVTSVHGLVEEAEGAWVVPFLNPASNFNQVSRLRLINRGSANASVSLAGMDDRGVSSGQVRLNLGAGESREVTARELESGAASLSGRLGDGAGKWRLRVVADQPIHLMSLLESPTGNLTNLSVAGGGAAGSTVDGGGSDFVEDQLDDFDVTIPGSCAREVEVCVRDHQCEDGDEAQVTVNGAVVFSGELFNAAHCVTVPVREGSNTIELYAINGTGFKGDYCSHIDANSGQIDVIGGNEQSQTWLHLGGAGSSAALNVTIGPDGPCRPERVVGDPSDEPSGGDGNDTHAGASALAIGTAASGSLDGANDVDYWRIEVPSRGRVAIESTGSTDTLGRLESASGRLLAENDNGGAGTNFKINWNLDPGTYYLRVSGSTGAYGLHVSHIPDNTGGGGGGYQPGQAFSDCAECPEVVVVPVGEFVMGSPSGEVYRQSYEGPQHLVRIVRPFAVGLYEVTFAEWDTCVAGGGCGGYWPPDGGYGREQHPVRAVSWEDAQTYVDWLSERAGAQYRLLSESEWEYVARAGTATPFHFGNTISSDQANYNGSWEYPSGDRNLDWYLTGKEEPFPVGSFQANAFGLHDVHGNVAEWVQDCYHGTIHRLTGYDGAPADGSAWESGDCSRRIVRGGNYADEPWNIRSASRSWSVFDSRSLVGVGFRVARTLAP